MRHVKQDIIDSGDSVLAQLMALDKIERVASFKWAKCLNNVFRTTGLGSLLKWKVHGDIVLRTLTVVERRRRHPLTGEWMIVNLN